MNVKYYILVSIRLPFCGSTSPSDFCLISDVITDTINDLLACEEWDPKKVKSQYTEKISDPKSMSMDVPFAQSRSISVSLVNEPDAKAGCFIDDIITATVDNVSNLERIEAVSCTVIHAIAHNAKGKTHVPRQDIISDEQNDAEGAPEEKKIWL